jgi:hypothetical protein
LFILEGDYLLGNVITNVFKKMFLKENYLSALLVYILFGIISLILFFVFFGFLIIGMLDSISVSNFDFSVDPLTLLSTIFGSVYLLALFSIVVIYLFFVMYSFIINKLNSNSKNIFFGFGNAFKKGILLFIGILVLMLISLVIILVLSLISFIPIVGMVLSFLLILIAFLFISLGVTLLFGNLGKGLSLGKSLKKSIVVPFTNLKVLGYFLVLCLIYIVLVFVLSLISLIPIVGMLFSIFLYPLLLLFISGVALELSNIN